MTLRACFVATLTSFFVLSAASAQDTTEQARLHFEAGTRAFDTGDYENAVTEFQHAYDLTRHPDLLFNIYSAAERAGHLDRAADALTRFLAEGQLEEERRPVLQQRLARLRERIAERGPAEEDPSEPAQPSEAEASSVPAEPPEPSEPAAPPAGGVHPAAVATFVAAGVFAASFVVFAALSEVEDNALSESCDRSCSFSEVTALAVFNTLADVSWITAAVAGVTGVILHFALPPEGGSQTALAPWAAPHAGGVTAVGRW